MKKSIKYFEEQNKRKILDYLLWMLIDSIEIALHQNMAFVTSLIQLHVT
jgi:hypothetical protein